MLYAESININWSSCCRLACRLIGGCKRTQACTLQIDLHTPHTLFTHHPDSLHTGAHFSGSLTHLFNCFMRPYNTTPLTQSVSHGSMLCRGRWQQCLPQLLRLLHALIPSGDFSLIPLHELVALQNGNQLLSLGMPLQSATNSLSAHCSIASVVSPCHLLTPGPHQALTQAMFLASQLLSNTQDLQCFLQFVCKVSQRDITLLSYFSHHDGTVVMPCLTCETTGRRQAQLDKTWIDILLSDAQRLNMYSTAPP